MSASFGVLFYFMKGDDTHANHSGNGYAYSKVGFRKQASRNGAKRRGGREETGTKQNND